MFTVPGRPPAVRYERTRGDKDCSDKADGKPCTQLSAARDDDESTNDVSEYLARNCYIVTGFTRAL